MTKIYRTLLVHFTKAPVAIEHFLIEPDRRFFRVDLLHVFCQPSGPVLHFIRV